METKRCSKCREIKKINEFNRNKSRKDGYSQHCRICRKLISNKYYINNIERFKDYYKNNIEKEKQWRRNWYLNNSVITIKRAKKWNKDNPEKVKEINKKWTQNNLEKINETVKSWQRNNPRKIKEIQRRVREKRKLNPMFKLNSAISCSVRHSLKNGKNGKHWEILVNFTLQDLIVHLEKLFKSGMSFNNYGKGGWEIDHIRPVSSFNFTSYDDPEFKECWSLNNLQPLWEIENIKKGNKICQMS